MSNWDDIPDPLLPDPDQLPILNAIVAEIREAVRIRHDLQQALLVSRQVPHFAAPFESDIGKSKQSNNPRVYVNEHTKFAADVNMKIRMLKNDDLKNFLLKNIKRFLPDVSTELGPRALYRLEGPTSVLNELLPDRGDMLVRLLLVGQTIKVKGSTEPKANPFVDANGVYYF